MWLWQTFFRNKFITGGRGKNKHNYAGCRWHAEIGLKYYQHRMYSSQTSILEITLVGTSRRSLPTHQITSGNLAMVRETLDGADKDKHFA